MEHLDNLQVGEPTATMSLYPFWVRFKKVFDTYEPAPASPAYSSSAS
jgi:hypothetical protein